MQNDTAIPDADHTDRTGELARVFDGLIELAAGDSVPSAPLELAECALDSAIDSDALLGVPIISGIVSFVRASKSISTHLFAKKLFRFLLHTRGIPPEERRAFLAQLSKEPEQRRRLADQLALVLERLDDLNKPEFVARAFAAYVGGAITLDEFLEVAAVIDRCLLSDLRSLGQWSHSNADTVRRAKEWKKERDQLTRSGRPTHTQKRPLELKSLDGPVAARLYGCGVIELNNISTVKFEGRPKHDYTLTDLGLSLLALEVV